MSVMTQKSDFENLDFFFHIKRDKSPFGYLMKSIFKSWLLKVCKFQNQTLLFSFETKTKQKYCLNSALASKMNQIKRNKALYYINYGLLNTIEPLIFVFDPF